MGDLMLVDELNLAEDSVIERLNSVLEKPGLLVLAEKGGRTVRGFQHGRVQLFR